MPARKRTASKIGNKDIPTSPQPRKLLRRTSFIEKQQWTIKTILVFAVTFYVLNRFISGGVLWIENSLNSLSIDNNGDNKLNNKTRPDWELVSEVPHDPSAFTQGLTYFNGTLWESTGLHGRSQVRVLDVDTGKVLTKKRLNNRMFGEGIAYYKGKLIQLTWQEKVGFVYNATTLELLSSFSYSTHTTEGWGITHNPKTNQLIVSDGSEWLHFWDDETFEEIHRVPVWTDDTTNLDLIMSPVSEGVSGSHTYQRVMVDKLNELEIVGNRLLANVWYKDVILSINIESGEVEQFYDFSTLWPKDQRTWAVDCFNGISVSDDKNEVWVTGKLWPKIYRIRLNR